LIWVIRIKKKNSKNLILKKFSLFILFICVNKSLFSQADSLLKLWYNCPAEKWIETLSIEISEPPVQILMELSEAGRVTIKEIYGANGILTLLVI
jgi:hypothetical protein